jgi:hypothetical protein
VQSRNLFHQLRPDREQIATRKLENLSDVAEACPRNIEAGQCASVSMPAPPSKLAFEIPIKAVGVDQCWLYISIR